jgi:uncharacterized RDD family membrane protein YckC
MKCPKCGYLGFEPVDRCRNCGYDFSLAQEPAVPDLPIRRVSSDAKPLDDLALSDRSHVRARSSRFEAEARADLDRLFGRADPKPVAAPRPAMSVISAPADELPLFGGPITDDVPLITRASAPRVPLSVRRATPEVPRLKADVPRPTLLDLEPAAAHPETSRTHAVDSADRVAEDAPLAARFVAVAIDLLILGFVDAIVIYLTLQICGLTMQDFGELPMAPLLAFLLLQNGGYLVAFTAGGQTLGKMASGIRVIPSSDESSLDLGRAVVRELLWLGLAAPAGLGFLSAVFSPDRRGLHDRFAGTRVVRVS